VTRYDDTTEPEQEIVYWNVSNIEEAFRQLIAAGTELTKDIRDVGDRIQLVSVRKSQRNLSRIIENSLFGAD